MTSLSTNNWDTAFGITFKDANAAIVAQGSSPAGFTGQHTVFGGGTVNVAASFGPWQMSGGSDSLLQMTLPLLNGTLSGTGVPSTPFTGIAVIQVSLGYIPQPDANTSDLKLNTGTGVSVLGVTLPVARTTRMRPWRSRPPCRAGSAPTSRSSTTCLPPLTSTPRRTPAHSRGCSQPTSGTPSTQNFDSVDDYRFGVLAMTEHRTGRKLSSEIDPLVIPDGSDAGFLIADERVITEMFLPNIEICSRTPPRTTSTCSMTAQPSTTRRHSACLTSPCPMARWSPTPPSTAPGSPWRSAGGRHLLHRHGLHLQARLHGDGGLPVGQRDGHRRRWPPPANPDGRPDCLGGHLGKLGPDMEGDLGRHRHRDRGGHHPRRTRRRRQGPPRRAPRPPPRRSRRASMPAVARAR